MKQIFAIGDIHGCVATFKWMLFEELKIQKEDEIYCVGDYIDRGVDSKGVIDVILSLREQGYSIHTLRGNHEQMMMESVQNLDLFNFWFKYGGDATLNSFGVDSYSDIDPRYHQFFEETKFYVELPGFIIVHAGLNFEREDIFEDKEAMLWSRGFAAQQPVLQDKILIHGHTPAPLKYILKQESNCINIDGGCVYKTKKNMGNLVAYNLGERAFHVVPCMD